MRTLKEILEYLRLDFDSLSTLIIVEFKINYNCLSVGVVRDTVFH